MALIVPEFLWNKKYSAERDRLALAHGGSVQAGVWDALDFNPSQRTAGANMSVDVAAGYALVQADSPGNLGLYHIQNDAVANVAITASHASLPRIDQVFVEVNDSTDGGDASDIPQFTVVAGTPTSGATLDNRNGAGATPANSLRVADILVPAASTTVTDANIRDRRPFARGARVVVTGGGTGDYSTSSTTFASIDATNFRPRLECSGVSIRQRFLAVVYGPGTTARNAEFRAYMDSVALAGSTKKLRVAEGAVSVYHSAVLEHTHTPAAGSHLFDWWYRSTSAGQAVTLENTTAEMTAIQLEVFEELRPNGSNF